MKDIFIQEKLILQLNCTESWVSLQYSDFQTTLLNAPFPNSGWESGIFRIYLSFMVHTGPRVCSHWYTFIFSYFQIIVWWVLWNRIFLVHAKSLPTRLWIQSKMANVLTQPCLMFNWWSSDVTCFLRCWRGVFRWVADQSKTKKYFLSSRNW